MSRLVLPQESLPRLGAPVASVALLSAAALVGAGAGMVMDAPLVSAGVVTVSVCSAAAQIVFHVRTRQRQGIVDLLLMRISSMLGWSAPDRAQLTARKWDKGWIGHPTKLRVKYHPLADEALADVLPEVRKYAEKAFGIRYKLARLNERRAWFELAIMAEAVDTDRDLQIERVNTVVAKTFGSDAKAAAKFDEQGKLREITVKYEVTPRLSSSALRARIEHSVSSVLHGRWRAFWDLQNDTVRLEVRPDLQSMIHNPNVAPADVNPLDTYDQLRVPIGVDEDGNTIAWRPKDDPHGLITGKTGKGKTVVLLGIIMYLAAHGWKVWGIDGKRIELLGLREWPNVELIAGRIDHQARVAHKVFEMMQQRFADYEAGLVRLEDFEPVLFVIDEYKTFRNAVSRWYRSPGIKPRGPGGSQAPVLEEISDFVSLARKVRMHLLIGLQRPDAEFLTGDMRDNFNFRVSLGRLSPEGAKMMWDSFSTGVTINPKAKGRGIAHNSHGEAVEIQTYWTPDPYQTEPNNPAIWVTERDLELVNQLRPAEAIHQLKEIVDPDDVPNLDETPENEPNYTDYMQSRIVVAGTETARLKKNGVLLPGHEDTQSTRVQLERIQREEAEPELDDADEMFTGYQEPTTQVLDELLDDSGEFAGEGIIALIDPDNDLWGLIDFAEYDESEDGYMSIGYRDFETGEPGALSLPVDHVLTIRTP